MKILLATDGSRHSRSAADLLKQAPFTSPGNEITVLVVVPATQFPVQIALRKEAEDLLRDEAQRLEGAGCTIHPVIREGHVAECIVETAEELGTELIVVGSRGSSSAHRFLLGSVSHKTMKYATCSVLLTRPRGRPMPSQGTKKGAPLRILVAYDGSPSAQAAVDALTSLPLPDDTEISLVTVLPLITHFRMDIIQEISPEWPRRKRAAQMDLEAVALVLRRTMPNVAVMVREGGDETEEILKVADEQDTDIIVLGHKGKSAIKRFLLGSVSTRVAHHARCSVWVVRNPGITAAQD